MPTGIFIRVHYFLVQDVGTNYERVWHQVDSQVIKLIKSSVEPCSITDSIMIGKALIMMKMI